MGSSSASPGILGQSRYALVARSLCDHINADRYPIGTLLPTEVALCQQFGVSRTTLREAIRWLSDRGMVSARRGIGTMVLAKQPATRYVHAVDSIADVFQYAKNLRNPIVLSTHEFDVAVADEELLRGAAGQRWIRMELTRTFLGDTTPLLYAQVYVPHMFGTIAQLAPTCSNPIYTLLESEYGEQILAVELEFGAAPIDTRPAQMLHVAPGSPSLCVIRHYFGSSKRLLLVTVSHYHPDRYSYRMRLDFNPQLSKRP